MNDKTVQCPLALSPQKAWLFLQKGYSCELHNTMRGWTFPENEIEPFSSPVSRRKYVNLNFSLSFVSFFIRKSRNCDTLGPAELIVWAKQGNQGDWHEQDDQGKVSIIIFGMSKSSGFQIYANMAEVICQHGGGCMPTRRRLYANTAEVICQHSGGYMPTWRRLYALIEHLWSDGGHT